VARLRRLRAATPRAVLALAVAGCGGGAPARSALVSIGAGVRGPAGAKATVYSSGLATASAFALDGRGRLWVATSAASDHRKDGVYLVPRAGARPVKVIAGVRGPLGLTWFRGRLYVASLGRVDAFSRLRGQRFARRTTIIRQPAGHGWNNGILPLAGGRLAMGISSACDHCASHTKWSAQIVSFRPDGSDVKLYARNIRAPFGLARDPTTSALLVSMNQRDDLGTRTPGDWLARVRQGENWRFPDCYGQGGAACRGVPAPLAVLDKHAAAGAVAVLGGYVLVSEWQAGRVMSAPLKGGHATPYLTGIRSPLPLIRAPDGALLVGDWATGRIYRITPPAR
jgi:glucose/arabinose dehydrogenase